MSKSEERPSTGPVTRRTFLRTSALATGAAALESAVPGRPVLRALTEIVPSQGETAAAPAQEEIVQCTCRPNCNNYCRLNVHLREGRVVKTSLAPLPDTRYNRICLRGLSHVQRIYDSERIRYPMKRAGKRGENKWERISWDEAITTITDQFKKIQEEYGKQAVHFYCGSGGITLMTTLPGAYPRLQNLIGASKMETCLDAALVWGTSRVLSGQGGPWGLSNEPADMVNAKTVMVWGQNTTESYLHNWHFVADAMQAGAKLVVIDPTFTHIAAKADKYVQVRPGSDPALLLSMIQVIISEKRYDRKFVVEHTVGPFLVREDTKVFMRMSDLGVAPTQGPNDASGKPTQVDPVAVWDPATQSAVAVGAVAEPALEGSFEIKGYKVRTAFDFLKEEANKYAPEVATKITDVDVSTIQELARIASARPVAHQMGFGAQAFDNGVMIGHALGALVALTGNIGIPGAVADCHWHYFTGLNFAFMYPSGKFGASVPNLAFRDVVKTGTFQGKPFPVKALFVTCGNLLSSATNQKEWMNEVWPKLDLVVVTDMVYTNTARNADIILPACHWFETEEITPSGGIHPFIQYSAKAIDPLFESKSDIDIIRLIAQKMGVGEFFVKSNRDLMKECLDTDTARSMGITFEKLQEKGAIRYLPDPYIPYANLKFRTPSGRLEFYVEKPIPRVNYGQKYDVDRERLPRFFPPTEAWSENPLAKKYPLVVMSERPRFRVHTQWFSIPWLRELDPEPIIKINAKDALERSIQNGDYVEVYNDRGHVVAKAVVTEGIRPGTLVYPKGWQRHQMVAGAFEELSSSAFDPVGVNQSFFDVLGQVRKWNGQVKS